MFCSALPGLSVAIENLTVSLVMGSRNFLASEHAANVGLAAPHIVKQ